MPYIKRERRDKLDEEIVVLQAKLSQLGSNAGDLNYTISRLVGFQFNEKPKYVSICMVMGTLLCVALEFYRRKAGPYEDKAVKKNGDIEEYM